MDTKYSILSKFFATSRGLEIPTQDPQPFKTTNKAEYEQELLARRQQDYLYKQFHRIETYNHIITQSFESRRNIQYTDYRLMGEYAIIGRALDIYASESTTVDRKGVMLKISSKSEKVKRELEYLFYDVMNIKTNAFAWIRSMCQFGDLFLSLLWDNEKGLIGLKELPIEMMERLEHDNPYNVVTQSTEGETRFRFRGDSIWDWKWWQVAHFRLVKDVRSAPYGASMLETGRRTWKNILLVEDAMRIGRLLRGIDRKIFYTNIGNIDPSKVGEFVEAQKNKLKRKPKVDAATGQVDLKYYVMGYDEDYMIPLRDGDTTTRIDPLPAATNLSEIADINYDLNQLFAALGIPKAFLNYEDIAGEGKGLAMLDVRFANLVQFIQRSFLMELNKIAQIHLFMVGMEDECGNFALALNNPSLAVEAMYNDDITAKLQAFSAATSGGANNIQPMSYQMAMKEILGMTDEEIELNFQQQLFERIIATEMDTAADKIKSTGLFKTLYDKYGTDFNFDTFAQNQQAPEEESNEGESNSGDGGSLLGGELDITPTEGESEQTAGTEETPSEPASPEKANEHNTPKKIKILTESPLAKVFKI